MILKLHKVKEHNTHSGTLEKTLGGKRLLLGS
jgi:hypothetical protein